MEHDISSSSLNGNDMRVLVALLEKGVTNLSGLKGAVANQVTRKSTVLKLAEMGLVEYDLIADTHLCYKVNLTDLGIQIAALLALGQECLSGNLDLENDSVDERARLLIAETKSKIRAMDKSADKGIR